MARPPLKDRSVVRTEVIVIRLSDEQKAKLVAAASKAGQPLAVWARLALIRAARTGI